MSITTPGSATQNSRTIDSIQNPILLGEDTESNIIHRTNIEKETLEQQIKQQDTTNLYKLLLSQDYEAINDSCKQRAAYCISGS